MDQNLERSVSNTAIGLDGPIKLTVNTWKFFKEHWKIVVSIVMLPNLFFAVSQILIFSKNFVFLMVAILLLIFAGILSVVSQPAAINAVHRLTTEPEIRIDVGSQYRFGFGLFWSVLFLLILQMLIALGSGVFFVIPAIIISVFVSLCMFVLVVENKRGFEAMTESYSLVKGRWFDVLGRILFMALISIVGSIILSGLSYIIQSILGIPLESLSNDVLAVVSGLILNSFFGSLYVIYLYKLYVSLRSSVQVKAPTINFRKILIGFMIVGIIVSVAIALGATVLGIIGSRMNGGEKAIVESVVSVSDPSQTGVGEFLEKLKDGNFIRPTK